MLKKTATVAVAAALGAGVAMGVAACGEDRGGDVNFEGGTETTGTATTGTTGTETTETGGSETTETGGSETTETSG